ncbi:hypothetical protein DL769_011245 [Monosporascus sp. CRB-8-3]|nr:hypothetical protein DL769_011245 [Monosporascus sp. CRB-8-3]
MKSSHQQSEVHPAKEEVILEHHDLDDESKKNVQQRDKFGSFEKVDPKEIALVRKLGMYMMWMYFLNFLNRNTIVNGKLNNLDKELNLVGSQYNTCSLSPSRPSSSSNTPLQTRWLTEEERQLAHHRVARDTTDKRYATSSTWAGLWGAAKDYGTWVFALMANLHLSANGFKNHMRTAVESLGFDSTITLVLTCPPNLLASITSSLR